MAFAFVIVAYGLFLERHVKYIPCCINHYTWHSRLVVILSCFLSDLLEVRSKAVHVLVVGQQSVVLSVEEVDVPDAQQSQQDGSVLVQRSGAKVVVLQQTVRHRFTIMYYASCLV